MKKINLSFILLALAIGSFGQSDPGLFSRLQAISNHGVDFYNVDGIEITAQKVDAEFTKKNITKKYKQLAIREKELVVSDSLLEMQNYYVMKSKEEPAGLMNNLSYYFIESRDRKLIAFTFAMVNKTAKEFEREFIRLVYHEAIPRDVFNKVDPDSLNFAGRKIALDPSCHWMGINNMQCSHYGQMNWSVHKDPEDAKKTVENQFRSINSGKRGRIISDTLVPVIFEGSETLARRAVFDFTGLSSALVGMSGGKSLTIYFVATEVRNHYVSCVMSFWNNDQVNPSGLSPLLEQVMRLK